MHRVVPHSRHIVDYEVLPWIGFQINSLSRLTTLALYASSWSFLSSPHPHSRLLSDCCEGGVGGQWRPFNFRRWFYRYFLTAGQPARREPPTFWTPQMYKAYVLIHKHRLISFATHQRPIYALRKIESKLFSTMHGTIVKVRVHVNIFVCVCVCVEIPDETHDPSQPSSFGEGDSFHPLPFAVIEVVLRPEWILLFHSLIA